MTSLDTISDTAVATQTPTPSRRLVRTSTSDRAIAWTAALFLIVGSLLFLAGGRAHPVISSALGGDASQFFVAFAAKVRSTHDWHAMHMMILVGPLFWALAAPTLLDVLRAEARVLAAVARSALVLSAALWAVAFVLDGFGAPVYAAAMADMSRQDMTATITDFAANAIVMSRLGLLSLVVGGIGIVVIGVALLGSELRTPWRIVVGASGILIGIWPLFAALQGEYAGGPFTSEYWRVNAIAIAAWFVGFGACAFGRAPEDRMT
ncbi:MAG TPA: hypothetical protein VJ672_17980 [Gemmatimonadaceae bacterium]|nr:hypothetical protein [Gemmatimonadaceae bacterium]